MSRVLVIGATGLLGRPVADTLQDHGHDVHRAARHIEESCDSHRLDLADVDDTERLIRELEPDVVVQMTGGRAQDPVRLAQINVVPTVNLIRAVGRVPISPTVFVSGSAAEYGDPRGQLVTENSPLRPLSPYGWMKLAETSTAISLARSQSVSLTVVRPFNPVTPRLPQTSALGNFRQQLLAGEGGVRDVNCGRVDIIRDFVGASFIAAAMNDLVGASPGGVVNICSGVGVRLEEIMQAAAGLLGVELRLKPDPDLVGLPAPSSIVGDPSRLYSLVAVRADSSPESLARELIGLGGF